MTRSFESRSPRPTQRCGQSLLRFFFDEVIVIQLRGQLFSAVYCTSTPCRPEIGS